jgi:hypothetical protein
MIFWSPFTSSTDAVYFSLVLELVEEGREWTAEKTKATGRTPAGY